MPVYQISATSYDEVLGYGNDGIINYNYYACTKNIDRYINGYKSKIKLGKDNNDSIYIVLKCDDYTITELTLDFCNNVKLTDKQVKDFFIQNDPECVNERRANFDSRTYQREYQRNKKDAVNRRLAIGKEYEDKFNKMRLDICNDFPEMREVFFPTN